MLVKKDIPLVKILTYENINFFWLNKEPRISIKRKLIYFMIDRIEFKSNSGVLVEVIRYFSNIF